MSCPAFPLLSISNDEEDLKHFMQGSIDSSFDELTHMLNGYLKNMMRPEQVSLEEARRNALANHEIEIGLHVKKMAP